jgi:predicted Zn-ribbon and HTH transcriptional regulator
MLTVPQRLREALLGAPPRTLKELSQELSESEKDLAHALEKLQLSLRHGPLELGIVPARCIACGFELETRGRVSKPSRCPSCRSERIEPPRFWIEPGS